MLRETSSTTIRSAGHPGARLRSPARRRSCGRGRPGCRRRNVVRRSSRRRRCWQRGQLHLHDGGWCGDEPPETGLTAAAAPENARQPHRPRAAHKNTMQQLGMPRAAGEPQHRRHPNDPVVITALSIQGSLRSSVPESRKPSAKSPAQAQRVRVVLVVLAVALSMNSLRDRVSISR